MPTSYFHVTTAHRELDVIGVSVVGVDAPRPDPAALEQPWEAGRPGAEPARFDAQTDADAIEFVLPSPLVAITDEVLRLCRFSRSRPAGRSGRRAGADRPDPHRHSPTRPARRRSPRPFPRCCGEREGVCQDFAHLAVACLRSMGLPARYVSGYLATDPPPGRDRMVGVDASHAWAAVRLPGGQWLAVDPTNDQARRRAVHHGRLGPRLRGRAAAARGDLHRRRAEHHGRRRGRGAVAGAAGSGEVTFAAVSAGPAGYVLPTITIS